MLPGRAEEVNAVRLRYRSRLLACRAVRDEDGELAVELAEPAARPAPGQTAVLYRGDAIVGYGTVAARPRASARRPRVERS